jgi:hypothetical protein
VPRVEDHDLIVRIEPTARFQLTRRRHARAALAQGEPYLETLHAKALIEVLREAAVKIDDQDRIDSLDALLATE